MGVLLHGGRESVVTWLPARIGAVTVPINVRGKAAELGYVVENADLVVLLTSSDFIALLAETLPRPGAPLRPVIVLDTGEGRPAGSVGRAEVDAAADTVDLAEIDAAQQAISADDPVVMLYTSGTTARPRGCLHSHSSWCTSVSRSPSGCAPRRRTRSGRRCRCSTAAGSTSPWPRWPDAAEWCTSARSNQGSPCASSPTSAAPSRRSRRSGSPCSTIRSSPPPTCRRSGW
nr:AMP-binding protein [Pseudonocardia nigra]